MLKHRQVTVHITHLSLFGFNGDPTVNLRHTGWKDWQLHLWHAFSYQPLATYATIFRLILISSTTRKSPPRSGGLNFPEYSSIYLIAIGATVDPVAPLSFSGSRIKTNSLTRFAASSSSLRLSSIWMPLTARRIW